jgi:hypothetical protein
VITTLNTPEDVMSYNEDFRADAYVVRAMVERALTKDERMYLAKLRAAHEAWCVRALRVFNAMQLPDFMQRVLSLNDIAPSSKPDAWRWQSLHMLNTGFYESELCDSDAWHELTLYATLLDTPMADECNAILEYASDESETCEHTFLLDPEVQAALRYVYIEVLLQTDAYGSDACGRVTKETRLAKEAWYDTASLEMQLLYLNMPEKDGLLTVAKAVLFTFVQTLQVLIVKLREENASVQEVPVLGENGILYHVMSTVIASVASRIPSDKIANGESVYTSEEDWSYLGFFFADNGVHPAKIAERAYDTNNVSAKKEAQPTPFTDEDDHRPTPFTDESDRWPTSYLLTFETGDAKPQPVTLDHDSTITVCAGETRLTVTVKKGGKSD